MQKKLNLFFLLLLLILPIKSHAFYRINDPYFEYQDYLADIDFNPRNHLGHKEGDGVVVAVIDSGVWQQHPDLINRMWVNNDEILNNLSDDDHNGYVDDYYGYNFVSNNNDMTTLNSHGTAVAGIISGERDSVGMVGIANKSKIMSLIVCGENGACSVDAIQKAIKYAADNGANVINLSLGGQNGYVGYSTSYDYYIKYAFDRNIVIVASAGNGDVESDGIMGLNLNQFPVSPVCNDNTDNMIIGVGATNAYWSNYGNNCVDITAPGEDIFTASVPVHDYYIWKDWNGTSFSGPMVAAAAAIIKSQQPSLKNWEIINIIENNAKNSILQIDTSLQLKQENTINISLDKTSYNAGEYVNVSSNHFSTVVNASLYNNDTHTYVVNNISVLISGSKTGKIKLPTALQSGNYKLEFDGSNFLNKIMSNQFYITSSSNSPTLNGNVRLLTLANVKGGAVYYIAPNGKKYVFPDSKTYFTWFKNFDDVEKVSPTELDAYSNGGMMPYKQGVKLITHQDTTRVYAIEPNGVLRPIPSETVAINLYGSNWASMVQDVIPGVFSTSYTLGSELNNTLPNGSIVKNNSNFYYIYNGTKRMFSSINILEQNGFDQNNTINIPNLSSYNDGPDINTYESSIAAYNI